ncbi:DUF7555 family protein [Natronococcus jeotgali]|uniref:Uncharacterized protein n=1 Tax=Natronococcus jeotgali DSM 18795 TaxID=1227498 RepID=L9WRW3_9EURY|nr:hypothetical protein [Natronococcus jeotgali]ELY51023.1 hypothetical protein C492_21380 [Natronococcus jeotgali DSM 18795]
MPDADSRDRLRRWGRIWADGLAYALAVALFAGAGSLVLSVATGGGLVRAKTLLFLAGWLLLAYGTVRLWPSSPDDVDADPRTRGEPTAGGPPTRFQTVARALPPARWTAPPRPERRLSTAGKLLLGGLLVLLLSLLMEVVFGVA